MNHGVLSIRTVASASTTPVSSTYPSAYLLENEDEDSTQGQKQAPFPFLSLPSELRNKIYSFVFSEAPQVLDLDPSIFHLFHKQKMLALFTVSRQIHLEATHHFFSTHTFRLFPTYPGRYFKTKKPLLARLPKHYRSSITNFELRLGPGWNAPPRGWVVNDALGLKDCINVRVLKIFVECDPSDAIFKGFRASDGFYERFSQNLLDGILKEVPSIKVVEFDAWSSVKRNGDMIAGLGEVVSRYDKVVGWGPERGWDQELDRVWLDAVLVHGGGKLSKSLAVFA
ncbi:hypothetical protein M430DRAFT_92314 [Amorphotheca resinae ATCC 22711]|jgi:hypothetical protein|uniref:F-box domain-containing protein n=1 Tax=Amorphotheca resinae ATCC 22711 TaxID=857342 RepID=A0A2T3BGB4_AMORE|nr:hypothetical protein M430DRAFT_92314 [Amorphotheca resinae ATCC 22711]PSS28446.1 hypothetical protein M430DRAFT_92314 [Amorphotheca resinae ATCC 22711]